MLDRSPVTAAIIAFPGSATSVEKAGPDVTQFSPSVSAISIATKFTDHFLPVVQASMDLLEADEADFEARCRSMLDVDGAAMIDELCQELEIVGRQMKLLADGLDLTRARLRTAMARLSMSGAMIP